MMHPDVGLLAPDLLDHETILAQLDQVLDPELDTSIVKLGFVVSIDADKGHLSVTLRLPTYFCSPNFVYLMAADARDALLTLDGVREVTIRVGDHFASEAIESGVNSGKSFAETFPDEAWDNLDELRDVFRRKGYLKRQEAVVRRLRQCGCAWDNIARLRLVDLVCEERTCYVQQPNGQMVYVGPVEVVRHYLLRRAELGLDSSADAPLMLDENGVPVSRDQLEAYMIQARTVRVSLEANGSLCSVVLDARKAAPCHSQLFHIR
jgi:metal-sulfur cluster biosynthetic enzyme